MFKAANSDGKKSPPLAVIYIGLMLTTGASVLALGLANWQTTDWRRFLFYCAVAAIASRMKITLCAGASTMSMNFLFVLLAIAELSLGETLVVGSVAIVAQRILQANRPPTTVQLLFNVASVACSIGAAYFVYHIALREVTWLQTPTLMLLGATAYFLINTVTVALVVALTESAPPWKVWRSSYAWSFPNYLVGAVAAWLINSASAMFGWQTALLLLPVLYFIYRTHRLHVEQLEQAKARSEAQRAHAEEMAALHHRTIEALALAIEAKDQTTHDHLGRVEAYAVELGRELGLNDEELRALQTAALLHDIGKLAVPEHIISKPGKLTPEEFEKMKIHPVVGAEILEQVRFPYPVVPVVRSHHERWDGKGYPDGLCGEQIPIGARILSAVDCLDAIASDRQYRRALPLDEAIEIVKKESGKAFDPRVVEVLARRYTELEGIARSKRAERSRLSTDVKIERGASPAAGFEAMRAGNGSGLANLHASLRAEQRRLGPADPVPELECCLDRASLFDQLRKALAQHVPYDVMAVYVREGERLRLEFLDGNGYEQFASPEIPLGMGLSGWVAKNHKSIVNGNPSVEPGYLNDPVKFSTLRSALAVPIESEAWVAGVLVLYRRELEAFSMDELRLVNSIRAQLASVLESTPH